MDILLELSGEHPTLPHAEVAAAFAAEGTRIRPSKQAARVIAGSFEAISADGGPADVARLERVLSRLAMAHRASVLWGTMPINLDAALAFAQSHPLRPRASFAIRAERLDDMSKGTDPEKRLRSAQIEHTLGAVWHEHNKVDLDDPQLQVRALMHHDDLHIGEIVWENDRSDFEWRAPKRRPHFSPVSGHPRLMRAIVNLARVPAGGTLYDPLCGTGGILIEAGLCGIRCFGSDIDTEMVQGTETNCAHYGVEPEAVFVTDVRDAPERLVPLVDAGSLDAVVTDLPYGQSASTGGVGPDTVAKWTLEAVEALLAPGKRAVIGFGDPAMLESVPSSFEVVERHEVTAHKSRTRTYAVLVRR